MYSWTCIKLCKASVVLHAPLIKYLCVTYLKILTIYNFVFYPYLVTIYINSWIRNIKSICILYKLYNVKFRKIKVFIAITTIVSVLSCEGMHYLQILIISQSFSCLNCFCSWWILVPIHKIPYIFPAHKQTNPSFIFYFLYNVLQLKRSNITNRANIYCSLRICAKELTIGYILPL